MIASVEQLKHASGLGDVSLKYIGFGDAAISLPLVENVFTQKGDEFSKDLRILRRNQIACRLHGARLSSRRLPAGLLTSVVRYG
ncbi:hypothetical protein [Rhizobium lusitanum]|uniref:hypothetical protein n=1 Tax=Rhizobium lusitanum TaxID=293958 RepID=UPI001AED31FF|nr:hypothetical protein [Rhizobium lusitanum]